MKKVFIVICLFLSLSLYAESEHKLYNVPKDFMGTYIPVQLELLVKEYMSYEKALNIIANSHYDILQLREDICYSQVRFSDGYAVKRKDFENWAFVEKAGEKYILDENGASYRKITSDYDSEGYEVYAETILKIIFSDVLENNNIAINGSNVKIYDETYKFNLWPSYVDDFGAICLSGCILKIEGISANIYATEPIGIWESKRTDKIIQTIPLFYWNYDNFSSSIYKCKDNNESLRLLRNLIYAKHGYSFKSEDLQKVFSDFSWYKIDSQFSEDKLSNLEKSWVRDIQRYETQN